MVPGGRCWIALAARLSAAAGLLTITAALAAGPTYIIGPISNLSGSCSSLEPCCRANLEWNGSLPLAGQCCEGHVRDSIFAQHFDESVKKLGIRVLKSPPRSPMGNAICECVIGTIRRECLDWLIPLSASHLRSLLKARIGSYSSEYPASR